MEEPIQPTGTGRAELDNPALFWAKVEVKASGCWEWQGAVNNAGYGVLRRKRKNLLAHRVAFQFYFGYDPAPFRLHKCDNPRCVRPDHLAPGDNSLNMRDCVAKGRMRHNPRKGELNNRAKLTASQIVIVRALCAAGKIPQREIGRLFGISQAAVWYIAHRRNWGHIP